MRKSTTKLISMLLAVLLTVSCFTGLAIFGSSAADEPQKVYFKYPSDGRWGSPDTININKRNNLANVYCYAYSIYGNTSTFTAPSWEARSTQCTYEGEVDGCKVFSYDLSKYGHIDDNADYGIIFSTKAGTDVSQKGFQTTDLTMTSDCIGDTIVVIDGTRQNASDSEKQDHYAKWENNPQCGVKANISSLGVVMPGIWPFYQPRAQQLSNSLKQYLLNGINIPYFDLAHNTQIIKDLSDDDYTVTALDVYKQYLNDNADALATGTPEEVEVKVKGEVRTLKAVQYDKDGTPTNIPAPEYVMEVLGLTEDDLNPTTAAPTTEAVETTAEPTTAEPTTVAPTTAEPTTAEPTTVEPTTVAPITEPAEPTTAPAPEDTYVVAGNAAEIFGASWAGTNEDAQMTKGDDGKYSITFANAPAMDEIQLKVVKNGSDWIGDENGNNVLFNNTKEADITVTYDPETNAITVTGEGVDFNVKLSIEAMYAVGNGEGTWLNGIAWDPAAEANKMNEVADGIYEITINDVAAYDNWQIKFAAGSWTNNWGLSKEDGAVTVIGTAGDAAYDGDNLIVVVDEDGSTVKAQIDLREFDMATKKGAKYTITVTAPVTPEPTTEPVEPTTEPAAEDVYVVAGNAAEIFGASWAGTNEDAQMTKGDDGKYSITFANAPAMDEIQLKVVKNGTEWIGDETGNNVTFNNTKDADITVTYDPETKAITVTGEGVDFNIALDIDAMYAVGNGEGTWLNGVSWDPAAEANKMTEVADGIYEITINDVDAYDNWQIKFAANGNWTHNWGVPKDENDQPLPSVMNEAADAGYNGDNIIVKVEEDGSTVTARLDLTEFDMATKKGAKYTITVTAPSFEFTYGDVNGDGNVDINDATIIQKAGIDLVVLEGGYAEAADVNGDGRISVLDATAVQKYAAGYTDGYFKAGQGFNLAD